ncbi:glycosyltransferase [Acinetobacter cumulans]|uniref:Glycosyltransferase n=1 Tax=Acinetobacter cumulans TaxID=2136182 RepID=A0A498DBV0_9GAMM|nr:glycosyltransferase [Acinetobacter cumulans]RLL38309.1 glycosyltransferase [Acinetobacter cumulans]
MRIIFVLPHIVVGGVDRVTLRLVSELQKRGHQCFFALRRSCGGLLNEAQKLCPVYELAKEGLHHFVPNLAKLINSLKATHIITAFADIGFLTYLSILCSRKKIIWIHGVHGAHNLITAKPTLIGHIRFKLDKFLSKIVYAKCKKIIAVSNGVKIDILEKFNCPENKVVTIYNPVLDPTQFILKSQPEKKLNANIPIIVAMGRLTRVKGFDILIKAMKIIPQPWMLYIWGEGEEKEHLQNLIKECKLEENIFLKGNTNQPFKVLREADIFVLSSRSEGLPTVLIEALCCQCKIVATNCPHGPAEILEDGLWGYLVENQNPKALAKGIIEIMKKEPVSAELIFNRSQIFTVKTATDKWEDILNEK